MQVVWRPNRQPLPKGYHAMSSSLLYHAFNLKQGKYRSTRYEGNRIIFKVETDKFSKFCTSCKSRQVIFKGCKIRHFHLPPVGRKRCLLELLMHRLYCKNCGCLWWPRLQFMDGNKRYTRAFAQTALDLLQFSTVKAVADYLRVGWDLIKQIHKNKLQSLYRKQDLSDLVYLGIDEFSIRKGHSYMTIFVDLQTGRIIHVVEGRSVEAIAPFLQLIAKKAHHLKAVSVDMSQSYIKAISENLPQIPIVFDHYHISAMVNRAIDSFRRELQSQMNEDGKKTIKGGRFLFLRNYADLDDPSKAKLHKLMNVNKSLFFMYNMKELLRYFWKFKQRSLAEKFLHSWCVDVLCTGIRPFIKLGMTLGKYKNQILNYFDYRISNAIVEGTNNKIKTLKRQAYGFRDMEYFKLRLYHLHSTRYSFAG